MYYSREFFRHFHNVISYVISIILRPADLHFFFCQKKKMHCYVENVVTLPYFIFLSISLLLHFASRNIRSYSFFFLFSRKPQKIFFFFPAPSPRRGFTSPLLISFANPFFLFNSFAYVRYLGKLYQISHQESF